MTKLFDKQIQKIRQHFIDLYHRKGNGLPNYTLIEDVLESEDPAHKIFLARMYHAIQDLLSAAIEDETHAEVYKAKDRSIKFTRYTTILKPFELKVHTEIKKVDAESFAILSKGNAPSRFTTSKLATYENETSYDAIMQYIMRANFLHRWNTSLQKKIDISLVAAQSFEFFVSWLTEQTNSIGTNKNITEKNGHAKPSAASLIDSEDLNMIDPDSPPKYNLQSMALAAAYRKRGVGRNLTDKDVLDLVLRYGGRKSIAKIVSFARIWLDKLNNPNFLQPNKPLPGNRNLKHYFSEVLEILKDLEAKNELETAVKDVSLLQDRLAEQNN
jgi:hypothetical protein